MLTMNSVHIPKPWPDQIYNYRYYFIIMARIGWCYFDMFKYSNNFFQALKTSAQNNMQAAPWQVLNEWLTAFDNMNAAENF